MHKHLNYNVKKPLVKNEVPEKAPLFQGTLNLVLKKARNISAFYEILRAFFFFMCHLKLTAPLGAL